MMEYLGLMDWDPQVDCLPERSYQKSQSQERNRYALRSAIASILGSVNIPATLDETAGYAAWTVLDEPSLDEVSRFCKANPVDCDPFKYLH